MFKRQREPGQLLSAQHPAFLALVFCQLLSARSVAAQRPMPTRSGWTVSIVPQSREAPGGLNVSRLEGTDSQESSEPAELPIGFFERQVRSGVRTGKVVGLLAAAGTFAIVATTRTEPDDPAIELVDLTYTLVVGLLGYAAGSAVGVHRYSAAQGIRSPFLATAAGALGGLIIGLPLGGILSLYTAPRGAAWAHNAMHRHSSGRL